MNTSPYLAFWQQGAVTLPEADLIAWANRQRLLPLWDWRAKQLAWEIPAALARAALAARYREQAPQTLAERQLCALGELAHALDIPLVLVKGAAIAQVYPAPWMRAYNDIDLLVAEENLTDFLPALTDLGYTWAEALSGQRGWHLPPLSPTDAGLKLEIHTALARDQGRSWFTLAQWRDGLRPFAAFPGLYVPDPVDHALYVIHHAIVHHVLTLGVLPFVDLKFWTQSWTLSDWQSLSAKAHSAGLPRAVALALALTAWVWEAPWPADVQQLFPPPPDAILTSAQHSVLGEGVQRVPQLWRDVPERSLRGFLKYAGLVLLGDPEMRRALPLGEKLRFYMHRPFQLLTRHGPALWRLVRGERQTRRTWRIQQRLQTWLRGGD